MTNRERAAAARAAINTYTKLTYGDRSLSELVSDDVFTAVSDLIGDLGHLLEEHRRMNREDVSDFDTFTIENATSNALRHYDEEKSLGWDEVG